MDDDHQPEVLELLVPVEPRMGEEDDDVHVVQLLTAPVQGAVVLTELIALTKLLDPTKFPPVAIAIAVVPSIR